MRTSVPRRNKKKRIVQPVIITTENKFNPKISERTIRRQQEERERRIKGSKYASGLDLCGVLCLYVFLILAIVIGAGGIGVCSYYINTSADSQGWKIAGIVMGAIVCVIGFILILITIFKQTRNRPWRYKKEEAHNNGYYGEIDDDEEEEEEEEEEEDDDDDAQTIVENFDNNRKHKTFVYQGSSVEGKAREIALSPIQSPYVPPLNFKPDTSEMIFCPGCNRTHPSAHQCMYSTRIANGFAAPFRPAVPAPPQDSIAIQTEEDGKKKTIGPHTLIDRSLKYSNTTETQTNVSANPRSNITESIILRRVPIPTAKVIVQQPTTKVMIVKVPNVAGQLVIQQKPATAE